MLRGCCSWTSRRPGWTPGARIGLWDAIGDLVRGGTGVLLTTQHLDEDDHLAGQVVIIDHGRLIAAGSPAELKGQAGRDVIEVRVADRESLGRASIRRAPAGHNNDQRRRTLTQGPAAEALLGHTTGYYVLRAVLWAVGIAALFAIIATTRIERPR